MALYRYRIKNTGFNSSRFGPCEICHKHCAEVFLQVEEARFEDSEGGGWTQHETAGYVFGHEQCLLGTRR